MGSKKQTRQDRIVQLVGESEISSQEQLRRRLELDGHSITQATLSRDLRELQISKRVDEKGNLCYQAPERVLSAPHFRCQVSGNLLVLHTEPGMAAPLAYRIDAAGSPHILGTVAGEDTVLAVISEEADANRVKDDLWQLIGTI